MGRDITVTFDDGTNHVYQNAPDDVTPEQVTQRAQKEFAGKQITHLDGGKGKAPKAIDVADQVSGGLVGGIETATALASGAIAPVLGTVKAVGSQILHGKLGDPAATAQAGREADQFAQDHTYQPRTQSAQSVLGVLGSIGEATKDLHLEGVAPMLGGGEFSGAQAGTQAVAARTAQAAKATTEKLSRIGKVADEMEAKAGAVGADVADAARMRDERAKSLPHPVELTKGQKDRTFDSQSKENTLSTDQDKQISQPLRDRRNQQNQALLKNFDTAMEKTGAESPGLIPTGRVITQAVNDKFKAATKNVSAAYKKAREAGEMEERVPTDGLVKYLNENRNRGINAGVIPETEGDLIRLGGAKKDANGNLIAGKMSLDDYEEMRKAIGVSGLKDETNGNYARGLQSSIDEATEGKGGDLYKYARGLHREKMREFEDIGLVDKMLDKSTKGSYGQDRKVALEDVWKHSVMGADSTNQSLRFLRRTLQTAGADGKQAWKELQGETIRQIKEMSTKGEALSAPALKKIIGELDKDDKLTIIFGKKGAQQLRDIRDVALDVNYDVPGSKNYSGTTSSLMRALDAMHAFHVPVVGKIAGSVKERTIRSEKMADVKAALGQDKPKQRMLKDYQPPAKTGTDE